MRWLVIGLIFLTTSGVALRFRLSNKIYGKTPPIAGRRTDDAFIAASGLPFSPGLGCVSETH